MKIKYISPDEVFNAYRHLGNLEHNTARFLLFDYNYDLVSDTEILPDKDGKIDLSSPVIAKLLVNQHMRQASLLIYNKPGQPAVEDDADKKIAQDMFDAAKLLGLPQANTMVLGCKNDFYSFKVGILTKYKKRRNRRFKIN